jgi:hypothetical protein
MGCWRQSRAGRIGRARRRVLSRSRIAVNPVAEECLRRTAIDSVERERARSQPRFQAASQGPASRPVPHEAPRSGTPEDRGYACTPEVQFGDRARPRGQCWRRLLHQAFLGRRHPAFFREVQFGDRARPRGQRWRRLLHQAFLGRRHPAFFRVVIHPFRLNCSHCLFDRPQNKSGVPEPRHELRQEAGFSCRRQTGPLSIRNTGQRPDHALAMLQHLRLDAVAENAPSAA